MFPLHEAVEVARLSLLLGWRTLQASRHRGEMLQSRENHLFTACCSPSPSIFDTWPVRVTEKDDMSRCQAIHNQSDSGETRVSRRDRTCTARSRLGLNNIIFSHLFRPPCFPVTLTILVEGSETALGDNQTTTSPQKAGQASHP